MIKSTFRNIGPIKEAELELGDLTIIAGQNNTGKTYLVYTLYGFLEDLREWMTLSLFDTGVMEEISGKIKQTIMQMKETGKGRIHVEEYSHIKAVMIREASEFFSSEGINEVFSSPNGEFENACFNIEFMIEKEGTQYTETARANFGRKNTSIISYFEDDDLVFEFDNPENITLKDDVIEQGVVIATIGIIQKNSLEPFILSAERFGISLFYKELDFTKNRLVEELQKLPEGKRFDPFRFLEKTSARYAQPIKKNIDFTRDLSNIQKKKGSLIEDKFHSVDKIMQARYKAKDDQIRFISKAIGNNRFDIPLHLASSSARGLSDLYFYLKHIAKPGQLLIIDEPESHLSPTNQISIARLLVFCVRSGLKVLVTTHSDYFIKEVNNLILLSNDFAGKERFLAKNKKDYTDNDFIKPEQVRAYMCQDGTLQSCKIDATGIDMPVFDDAIDKINKISNELALFTTTGNESDD